MTSLQQIKQAVKKLYPHCTITKIHNFTRGMVNEIYGVHIKDPKKEIILRVYKNQPWTIVKEQYLYDLIKKKTNIPVPTVLKADFSKKIIKENYAILNKIPGIELDKAYRKEKHAHLAREAGEYLAKIHSIKFNKFGWIVGRKIKPAFNTWSEFVWFDSNRKLKNISKIRNIPKNIVKDAKTFIADHEPLLNIKQKPCLLHKDFHASHVLVYKDHISGIIDIERAIAGHNELDLIKTKWWTFEKLPELEKPFFQGYRKYGFISKKFPHRSKLYELVLLIGLIDFSYQIKSPYWLKYNLNKINKLLRHHG